MLGNWFERTTGLRLTKDLFCTNQVIDVNVQDGAPYTFTKITSNASSIPISKGSLNKITFVPRILNEHAESSRTSQSIVTITNIVGQIFKASKENISALMLTLESAQGILIDDFESYNDNAELQAVWTSSGANPATLEQTIVRFGTKAMRLPTIVDAEEWSRNSAPQDFTGFTGKFSAYMSHPFNQLQIAVYVEDSLGNSKSFVIVQDGAGIWCDCEVNEAAMIQDQGTATDVTNIVKIGYRVVLKRAGSFTIIDELQSVPPPGDLEIKLWDMGTTLPNDGVTSINDGTQYDQIGAAQASSFILSLQGGKRLYHLHEFFAGVNKSDQGNEELNIDNYYIIELKYVDTNITVYGPDPANNINYYNNGYAFTTPDEVTAIAGIGPFSDIMFGIFSAQDIYFVKIGWRFNAEPNGNSEISVFLEGLSKEITDIVVDQEPSPEKSFVFNAESRPMHLINGGELEFYYSDDYSDSVSKVTGETTFWYEPPIING